MTNSPEYHAHLMELQALVASASTRFINVTVDDTHGEIVSCLGSIASHLEAEVVSVNILGKSGGDLKSRYYWIAPHVNIPPLKEIDGDDFSQFRWTGEIFMRGECVLVPSRESLPPHAAAELRVYDMCGIKSVFHIPIFREKILLGLISFFTLTKPLSLDNEMIRLLKMLGEIFANLYTRKESERAVAESERHYREMAELVPVAIYEMSLDGVLTYANSKGIELFGYTREELTGGMSVLDLIAPSDRAQGAAMMSAPEDLTGAAHAYQALRRDGTTFPVLIYSSQIIREGKLSGVRGAVVDLTGQKETEEKLRASLREKESLLRELHHRVKNNMQLVTSLFHLQASHVDNPGVKEILGAAANRLKSISLVHEQFYREPDFGIIDFLSFIQHLGVQLRCTCPSEHIEFTVTGDRLTLDMQIAIPLGILANEILSNAFCHAFHEGDRGRVFIHVVSSGEGWQVTMGDNGRGLPAHVDTYAPSTLGLHLIKDLAEQIDAELHIQREGGTVYTLRSPLVCLSPSQVMAPNREK